MAPVVNNQEVSEKVEVIIQAAQKVFGEFGFEKTSMKDIARELNYSKASLYYYFLDKESLFKAVIQKEQKLFLRLLDEIINKPDPVSDKLREYIILRHNYFRVFLNLSKLRMNESYIKNTFIHELISDLREQEFELVEKIFIKGKDSGEIREMDPARTSLLFMNIVRGLRLHSMKNLELNSSSPNPEDELLEEQLEFAEIFIKGIIKK